MIASQTGGSHVPTRLQDAGEELLTGLEGGSGGDGDARQQAREHRAAIKWGGSDAMRPVNSSVCPATDRKRPGRTAADLGRTPDVGRLFRPTVRLALCPSGESHMENCGKPNGSTGSFSLLFLLRVPTIAVVGSLVM